MQFILLTLSVPVFLGWESDHFDNTPLEALTLSNQQMALNLLDESPCPKNRNGRDELS